jgi:hypothetical protein
MIRMGFLVIFLYIRCVAIRHAKHGGLINIELCGVPNVRLADMT